MADAKLQPTPKKSGRAARVGKFGAVGLFNTILDFTIYNVLSGIFGFPIIFANLISTTITMIISFFANRNLVFNAKNTGSTSKQAVLFLVVTAFGLYVLQLGVLHFLTVVWLAPVHAAVTIVHGIGLASIFKDQFVINNTAKILGTLVSLIWNYFMYKRVVFK
jgi:putative flippase GtrA